MCVCLFLAAVTVAVPQFNPFHPSYFLAGYKSGCVSLYSLECATSLASWLHLYSSASEERLAGGYAGPRSGVVGLRWSAQRPSLFFVTDARGKCVAFDLLKNEQKPVATVSIGAGAAAAAGGMGAPLPVPGQTQPSSLPPPLPLLALSATVPGSSMALNQAMMAFPAPGTQPTVQVHMLRSAPNHTRICAPCSAAAPLLRTAAMLGERCLDGTVSLTQTPLDDASCD